MGEAWHWILTNPRAIVRMVAAAFAAYYFWRIWNSEDGDDDDDGGGGRRILKFLGLVDDDGEPERSPRQHHTYLESTVAPKCDQVLKSCS